MAALSPANAVSLTRQIDKVKVSSVLNDDTKQFGKQHLLDGDANTCWNSAPGGPHTVAIKFLQPVALQHVGIMFQGGFAGKHVKLNSNGIHKTEVAWEPLDNNTLQVPALAL